tara:strand:+ start:1892 stop:2377 length:486 start_codon:yes stop_codon:yes gene_type:complete
MSKVNLIYGAGDVMETHININPFADNPDGNILIRADITNLDKHVDDGELYELRAVDVINYIEIDKVESTINNWCQKIRLGGKIIIGGIDLMEVCKSFSEYKSDLTEANILLHGSQEKPYLIKRSSFTSLGLSDYLQSKFNFTIIKKRINSYKMIIEARREK